MTKPRPPFTFSFVIHTTLILECIDFRHCMRCTCCYYLFLCCFFFVYRRMNVDSQNAHKCPSCSIVPLFRRRSKMVERLKIPVDGVNWPLMRHIYWKKPLVCIFFIFCHSHFTVYKKIFFVRDTSLSRWPFSQLNFFFNFFDFFFNCFEFFLIFFKKFFSSIQVWIMCSSSKIISSTCEPVPWTSRPSMKHMHRKWKYSSVAVTMRIPKIRTGPVSIKWPP